MKLLSKEFDQLIRLGGLVLGARHDYRMSRGKRCIHYGTHQERRQWSSFRTTKFDGELVHPFKVSGSRAPTPRCCESVGLGRSTLYKLSTETGDNPVQNRACAAKITLRIQLLHCFALFRNENAPPQSPVTLPLSNGRVLKAMECPSKMTTINTRYGEVDADVLDELRLSFDTHLVLEAISKIDQIRAEINAIRDALLRLHGMAQDLINETGHATALGDRYEGIWDMADSLSATMIDWPEDIETVQEMLNTLARLAPDREYGSGDTVN